MANIFVLNKMMQVWETMEASLLVLVESTPMGGDSIHLLEGGG